MYNFSVNPDRADSGSVKWSAMKKMNPQVPSKIVPLSIADMELMTPPEIISGLQAFLSHTVLGYTIPTKGYLHAISNWMQQRHNWTIDHSWIVPSPGVVPALFNAVRAFTEEGDGVIIMPPVYHPFSRAITKNNRRIIENSLLKKGTDYYIDFDDLEKKAHNPKNKLLILCSPHNPVGRVWTKKELQKIADICLSNNVNVVSDEIHSDIVLPGYRHTVLASLNDTIAENCIICTAPSKTFNLAGLQVSNIIIKNDLLRRQFISTAVKAGYGALNIIGYKACEIAYTECSTWLDEFILLIAKNKTLCEDFIRENIPQIKITNMEGTYLQWWDCRALGMTKNELETFMTQQALIFGDEGYIFGHSGDGFERINLACPTSILESTLNRLKTALNKTLD
ncbi:MalY/PatB family protein [Pectinatus frisingensis]|uniref:MalY/PatB family protein n=1 Tax=Pectinatus frisingensis TaxID=865 RepID=UPI0018C6F80B|nr:MalY/PatB family protein [Pectinatus frisingensis]